MLRIIILYVLYLGLYPIINAIIPGPSIVATQGEVWPRPQNEHKTQSYYSFHSKEFDFKVTDNTCLLLENAVERYKNLLHRVHTLARRQRRRQRSRHRAKQCLFHCDSRLDKKPDNNYLGLLKLLEIHLIKPCEHYPHLEMDESYSLGVLDHGVSTLRSSSIWGILRGLESFSQLFYLNDDYSEVRINKTSIEDFPSYIHRGLLLDTARHFISLSNILSMLDAMAYNKLNILHWHIVDDQSFPFQSRRFPELSALAAYHKEAQYSPQDVARVLKYATDRGIRVMPEFDVPGHTRSWGVSHPEILTECYKDNEVVGLGPMDPTKGATYNLLRYLFDELRQVFPEQYLHIGGDEVDMGCWSSNPDLLEYMSKHNMTSLTDLHALFMRNTLLILANTTRPVVWQEVVDEDVQLPNNTLVQIWKSDTAQEIKHILNSGYRVLYSTCWYLDHLSTGGDWQKFYECNPRSIVNDSKVDSQIIGGEACMWAEVVDDRNLGSRIWPRGSAAAEQLWTGSSGNVTSKIRARLEEHTCRMIRRGISAQPPNGPGFCLV